MNNSPRFHKPESFPDLHQLPPAWLTGFGLSPVTAAAHITMGVFPKKKYVSSSEANTFAARYRAALAKRPFLLFGLPFVSIIVAGSFVLTPATAIRYEKHDRKVRQMTREEELGVGRQGRKVDIRDEYYVSRRGIPHAVWRPGHLLTLPVFHSDLPQRTSTIGIRNG